MLVPGTYITSIPTAGFGIDSHSAMAENPVSPHWEGEQNPSVDEFWSELVEVINQ